MAVNGTTLTADIGRDDLDIPVASVTGASAGRICKIENEYSVVVRVVGSIVSLRTRGDHGTQSVPHKTLTPVAFGDPADFPAVPPARHRGQMEQVEDVIHIGASGAIPLPAKDTKVILTGAAALAMTLPDPTRLMDGITLRIHSSGSAAHTITSASGFNAGGATVDVATFSTVAPAGVGNNLVLVASAGRWLIQSSTGVTVA